MSKAATIPALTIDGNLCPEAKPCPFCPSGKGESIVIRESATLTWLVCRDCGAMVSGRKTLLEAIFAWNNRREP